MNQTQAVQFSDVRSPALAEAVEYLSDMGIIQGYADGTFKPERTINRAEALKIIFEVRGGMLGESTDSGFPDVSRDEWFAKYVTQARRDKLIEGYADGMYRPNQAVNRAEFVKIAMGALPYYGIMNSDADLLSQYSDLEVSAWYMPYLSFGHRFDFLDKSVKFKPSEGMSRGAAAFIIYRIAEFHKDLSCETDECTSESEENTRISELIEEFDIDPVSTYEQKKYEQAQNVLQGILQERDLVRKGFSLSIYEQEIEDLDGLEITYTKSLLHYKGVPVWGGEVFVEWEGNVENLEADGKIFEFLNIENVEPKLSESHVMQIVKSKHALRYNYTDTFPKYSSENVKLYIYPDFEEKTAQLAYDVGYTVLAKSRGVIPEPDREFVLRFIVDANTGEILREWDDVQTFSAQGPGGNESIGKHEYGTDAPDLNIIKRGGECVLENRWIRVVDSLERKEGETIKKPFEFDCSENTAREVNGAYSPMNDALYYGTVVSEMYRKWFKKKPLGRRKLVFKVHYRADPDFSWSNASWNSKQKFFKFGDGNDHVHPLATDIGIVAHEIAHGFTYFQSGLIYDNMSGGMNEAYSDMAAKAAEYYLKGEIDWFIGDDSNKADGFFRQMDFPSLDGLSIEKASDYTDDLDVHYSSGVYNKAFYFLASKEGWDPKMAFKVMTRANDKYWTSNSTFDEGACGVQRAARRLRYSMKDVQDSFEHVGVTCDRELMSLVQLRALQPEDPIVPVSQVEEGPFPSGFEFQVESVTTSNAASEDRMTNIVVKGQGFPRTMKFYSEDCSNIVLTYRSGMEYRFGCQLEKVPVLHLDFIDESNDDTLHKYEGGLREVYSVSATLYGNDEVFLYVEGVGLENIDVVSSRCNEIETVLENTELLYSATCFIQAGSDPSSLNIRIADGSFVFFDEEVEVMSETP
ncbi:MAG: M4 family metallopeptidase [Candidatus Gracilibacteria bacterium]|nr:M4 family metallopeptidase [Candidatus Gracilibacteria bacterium]